jgi:hypothetical protein
MVDRLKSILARWSDLWCQFMHEGALWLIHGSYQCRQCFRVRVVPWADGRTTVASVAAKQPVSIETKRFVIDTHRTAA